MKIFATILFTCFGFMLNAQTPSASDTLIELPVVVVREAMNRQYYDYTSTIDSSSRTWGCGGNTRSEKNMHLAIPVDMMVRHYFGMSYWD